MPHNSGLLRGKLHHAGSPPLQQHPIVEMPPLQQPTDVEFLAQQPHVDELSSSADDDNNDAPPNMVDVYVSLPSMFNDKGLDDTALSCVAGILCCDPNSDTDEYSICMNCNGEAHTICTEQMNFQEPRSLVCSFARSFARLFAHLLVRSLVRSFVRSFVHLFVRSLVCSFARSFARSLTRSFAHSFARSLVRSFACCSLVFSFARSLVAATVSVSLLHPPYSV